MNTQQPNNVGLKSDIGVNCTVCKDLLANVEAFFEALENICESSRPKWLTVDQVAKELQISKSIVYRLIRNGELKAVDIVETGDNIAKKGHYRVKRSALDEYLENKRVVPLPQKTANLPRFNQLAKVKNHLRL